MKLPDSSGHRTFVHADGVVHLDAAFMLAAEDDL